MTISTATAIITAGRPDQRRASDRAATVRADMKAGRATAPVAAGIACLELIKSHGVSRHENVLLLIDNEPASFTKAARSRDEPVEIRACGQDRRRSVRWPTPWSAADLFLGLCLQECGERKEMVKSDGAKTRSSSPWPILIRKSRPEDAQERPSRTLSSPPGVRIIRTRSIT